MTAGSLATIGTQGAPCESCSHFDCIAARQIGAEQCAFVTTQISLNGNNFPLANRPDSDQHRDAQR